MTRFTEEDLQEGYDSCTVCMYRQVSVYYHDAAPAIKGIFWGTPASPAYLSVTCLRCHRKVRVKRGTVRLIG